MKESKLEKQKAPTLRERQKAEALVWMDIMGVHITIETLFRKEDKVSICESGLGDYAPVNKKMQKEIRDFEQAHDALVYLVIRKQTGFGLLDSFLFVSKYDEEWHDERVDLKDGYAMTYTINRDHPDCSEMGSITFRQTALGGIVRMY